MPELNRIVSKLSMPCARSFGFSFKFDFDLTLTSFLTSPYGLRHGATAIALDCVRKIIIVASVAFVIIECAILDHKLNTLIL